MPYRDIEQRRAYGREWIRRNAEKAREAMRRWRAQSRDEHNAEKRRFYARHRERIDKQKAAYHDAHPDIRRTAWRNRRARQAGAVGSHTTAEWLALLSEYGGRCAYCGTEGPLEVDHAVPLLRGGGNEIENCRPACPPCNRHKHSLTEDEYRDRRRRDGLYVRPPLPREGASGT